ncbi:hypothetical protein ABPG74_022142 [Tetrahymena malaccensis]
MKYLGFILALLFLVNVQCIYLKVGSKYICYQVKLEIREASKITYQASGKNENNFEIYVIESTTKKQIDLQKNLSEGKIEIKAQDEFQNLELCFRSTDSDQKLVSLEVYKFHESKPDSEYVSSNEIIQTERKFRDAEFYLQTLYTNFHHQSAREKAHRDIMKSTESKINICSIAKMLIVLIVITLQIVLITNQFKDNNSNKPEFQMI